MSSGFDSFNQLNFKLVKLAITKAKDEALPLNLETIIELSSVSEASIVTNHEIVELLKNEKIEVNIIGQPVKKQKNLILDLETFDIFEDIDNMDSISNIQIIEDVQIGDITELTNEFSNTDNIEKQVFDYHNEFSHGETLSSEFSDNISQPHIDQQASSSSLSKFVGSNKSEATHTTDTSKLVPSEIKKACAILGIDTHNITKENVMSSWKKELTQGSLHPDLGGSNEGAKLLNTAKDALLQYIDSTAPKLGKKFGRSSKQ